MKNLITKLTLIAFVVAVCGTASAVFSDSPNTIALWHCDVTNVDAGAVTIPDDNTSGRAANDLVINQYGAAKEAALEPNSPYGGDYLALTHDKPIAWTFPMGAEKPDILEVNLAFRANELISGDNYRALLWTLPVKVYNHDAKVMVLAYDAAGNPQYLYSGHSISIDTWYSVDFVVSNNFAQLVVGNDADGYTTDTWTVGDGLLEAWAGTEYIIPGWDLFDGTGIREFDGDLDEIRVALPIPEPFTFGLIGLLGFLAIRKK